MGFRQESPVILLFYRFNNQLLPVVTLAAIFRKKRITFGRKEVHTISILMLADKFSFLSSIALSDKESGVLRCFALGLGDRVVCKTLALSSLQLNQIEQNLLDKFCGKNKYYLVKKALSVGYLDRSNFSLEDVKTKTHLYVT